MDLISIIGQNRLYNFHSHTQFCDGRATMAEFAAEAVKRGFTHYGFSPHSPIPIESPCNMAFDQVQLYLDEVTRLKSLYIGRTNFYAAMEIDYLGKEWGPANEYFQALPLDYRIGSVHFIPSQEGILVDIDGRYESFRMKMEQFFHNDIRYVVDTFFDRSLDMVAEGHFDIIGHFDKIGHNASHFSPGIEDKNWYRKHISRLIEAIADSGIIAEINTKAWTDHHRMFPAPSHWQEVKRAGIPLIINSDAHQPMLIDASRTEAFDMLAAIG